LGVRTLNSRAVAAPVARIANVTQPLVPWRRGSTGTLAAAATTAAQRKYARAGAESLALGEGPEFELPVMSPGMALISSVSLGWPQSTSEPIDPRRTVSRLEATVVTRSRD
jgi:hypothetical protein